MPHTRVSNRLHIVFSTKERYPYIADEVRPRLLSYLGGIVRNLKSEPIAIGGTRDHVHLLINLPSTVAVSTFVQKVKANSSKWLNETIGLHNFAWQEGCGAFSVSVSHTDATIRYINTQVEHHRREDSRVEFARFLKKHGLSEDLSS